MKALFKGYAALLREMALLENSGAFLSMPAGLPVLVLVCGLIGVVRNSLSVALGILPQFYRNDPDVMFTMFVWPVHLFLFCGALLHGLLRLMGYRKLSVEAVFGLAFYLQMLHLMVPFFDWLGPRFGIPWGFVFGKHFVANEWYVNRLVMTLGIILAWLITGYTMLNVMKKRWRIKTLASAVTCAVTLVIILIPTYFVWPTFNTLFNRCFGIVVLNPMGPPPQTPADIKYWGYATYWQIYWGYGTYFTLTALLGLFYLLWQRHREKSI